MYIYIAGPSGFLARLLPASVLWGHDVNAALAPEEADRVPMLARGVSLRFLRDILNELDAAGRGNTPARPHHARPNFNI